MVCLTGLSACSTVPTAVPPSQAPIPPALTRLATRTLPAADSTGTPLPGIILTPTPTIQVHTVAKDELGSTIALHYGISLAQLKSANPDVNLDFLKEGTQLFIPPRSTTPSAELYTPTPVTLIYSEPRCYPTAAGDGWCLVNVRNPQDRPAFYLTGEFLVQTGGAVYSQQATGLADILPAGGEMALIAHFDETLVWPVQIHFTPTTAFQAESPRVQAIAVENIKSEIEPNGLWANVSLTLHAGTDASHPAVILIAYEDDQPAGIRRIELTQPLTADARLDFSGKVFTTGPHINRVVVYAESREN